MLLHDFNSHTCMSQHLLAVEPGIVGDLLNPYHTGWLTDIILIIYFVIMFVMIAFVSIVPLSHISILLGLQSLTIYYSVCNDALLLIRSFDATEYFKVWKSGAIADASDPSTSPHNFRSDRSQQELDAINASRSSAGKDTDVLRPVVVPRTTSPAVASVPSMTADDGSVKTEAQLTAELNRKKGISVLTASTVARTATAATSSSVSTPPIDTRASYYAVSSITGSAIAWWWRTATLRTTLAATTRTLLRLLRLLR